MLVHITADTAFLGGVAGSPGGSGASVFGPANNLFGDTAGDINASPTGVSPATDKAAAEATRDAYFTANPGVLADYDADFRIAIRLIFNVGSDVFYTNQHRQSGEWISEPDIQGTDFSNVSSDHIPAIDSNGQPYDSGIDVTNTALITPKDFQVGLGTVLYGQTGHPVHAQSSGGEQMIFANLLSGIPYTPGGWSDGSAGGDWDSFHRKGGVYHIADVIQGVDTDQITNPSFQSPLGANRRDYRIGIKVVTAQTNCYMVIKQGGTPIFESKRQNLVAGDNVIDLSVNNNAQGFVDLVGSVQYTVDFLSEDGDLMLLGDSSTGTPYIELDWQEWEDVQQANLDSEVDRSKSVTGSAVAGEDIVAGQALAIDDAALNSEGLHTAIIASSDSTPCYAFADEDATSGSTFKYVAYGRVSNVDTSGLDVGSTIYLATGGAFGERPQGSVRQAIGIVEVSSSNGSIIADPDSPIVSLLPLNARVESGTFTSGGQMFSGVADRRDESAASEFTGSSTFTASNNGAFNHIEIVTPAQGSIPTPLSSGIGDLALTISNASGDVIGAYPSVDAYNSGFGKTVPYASGSLALWTRVRLDREVNLVSGQTYTVSWRIQGPSTFFVTTNSTSQLAVRSSIQADPEAIASQSEVGNLDSALTSVTGRVEDLEDKRPDTYLGTIGQNSGDFNEFPEADSGEYVRVIQSAGTVDGVDLSDKEFREYRCTTDGTSAGNPSNWELIPIPAPDSGTPAGWTHGATYDFDDDGALTSLEMNMNTSATEHKIIISSMRPSTYSNIDLQLRRDGDANYITSGYYWSRVSTISNTSNNSIGYFRVFANLAANRYSGSAEITLYTGGNSLGLTATSTQVFSTTGARMSSIGGGREITGQWDRFRLFPTSGNISGGSVTYYYR